MQSTAVFLLDRYSGNGNRVGPIPNPGSVTDGDRYTLGGPLYFIAWFMPQPARLKSREPPGATLKIARRPTSRAPRGQIEGANQAHRPKARGRVCLVFCGQELVS